MGKSKRRKVQQDSKPQKQQQKPQLSNSTPKSKAAQAAKAAQRTPQQLTPSASKQQSSKNASTTAPRATSNTREPVIPFDPYDRILLVGEGDFSFARALVEHHGCAEVTATCFDSREELIEKYPQALENTAYLETEEQRVLHSIDATKLGKEGGGGKELRKPGDDGKIGFDKIMFNFPHVGGKSTDVNRQVRYNQELLVSFFRAAMPLLARSAPHEKEWFDKSAQILVTLFEQPPYTLWNIRDLARHVGLRPVTSSQFLFDTYPGYKHARTIGNIVGKEEQGNAEANAAADDEEKKKDGVHKRPGKWRGEERRARIYIFELSLPSPDNAPKKKGRKRKADDVSSDDDE